MLMVPELFRLLKLQTGLGWLQKNIFGFRKEQLEIQVEDFVNLMNDGDESLNNVKVGSLVLALFEDEDEHV